MSRKGERDKKSSPLRLLNCVSMRCDIQARVHCYNQRSNKSSEHLCLVISPRDERKDIPEKSKSKPKRDKPRRSRSTESFRETNPANATTSVENFSYHSVSDEAVHEPRLEFSQFVRGGSEFAFDQYTINQPFISIQDLQELAHRQQHQIEDQQEILSAMGHRLNYLRSREQEQYKLELEVEKLRFLQEKVNNQEKQLNELRTIRSNQSCTSHSSIDNSENLESVRRLFSEKEHELAVAFEKIDQLTQQLQVYSFLNQKLAETERLEADLVRWRRRGQKYEQKIASQRARLESGLEEMKKIDAKVFEFRELLRNENRRNIVQDQSQDSTETDSEESELKSRDNLQFDLSNDVVQITEVDNLPCDANQLFENWELSSNPDFPTMKEKEESLSREVINEDEEFIVPEITFDPDPWTGRIVGILKKARDSKEFSKRSITFEPLALLLDASLEGELEVVRRAAEQIHNPSASNDEGITALHNAICAGHLDVVKLLVEFGCDVNAPDADGWTPLHCAASCNNLGVVRFLIENGACIFASTLSDKETAVEKCEPEEEGFDCCSKYLSDIQNDLGRINDGIVYGVFDFDEPRDDELGFAINDKLEVLSRDDDSQFGWWWSRSSSNGVEGYIPRNFLGLYPRVEASIVANRWLK